jgi:ATP-binding cassette subfamily B protein
MNQKHIFELGLVKLRLTSLASFSGLAIQMMVITYVSYRVLQGELKTGELMAILALTSVMLPSVSNLALLAIPFNEAKIALDRLFEFVDLPGEDTAANPTIPNEIEIRSFDMVDVFFKFPGRPRMLNQISITAQKGEIIGIIGPSGSGKTSLLNLVERIYTPSQGEIRVNGGVDISSINLSTWRKAVTCVPQQVHLFNGTVMENILLGRPSEEGLLGQLLENSELVKFISHLPQGLNTLVGQNGANVSGGQKQWIGLMRALYYKPQLLLLDEITAGMDYQSELEAIGLLKRFRPQMIIVFVSHRLHTLPILCERTYIMGDNKIIAAGHHSELLQAKNIYSEFWNALGDN